MGLFERDFSTMQLIKETKSLRPGPWAQPVCLEPFCLSDTLVVGWGKKISVTDGLQPMVCQLEVVNRTGGAEVGRDGGLQQHNFFQQVQLPGL